MQNVRLRVWCLCALLSLVSPAPAEDELHFRLLVLHTNDMHSRFDQIDLRTPEFACPGSSTNCVFGGFPRLKTAVHRERERAHHDPTVDAAVFLNAGDTFQGSALYAKYKSEIAARMLVELGIDFMSLGTHEFDEGTTDAFISFIRATYTPIVVCNLYAYIDIPSNQWAELVKGSRIQRVKGREIGIVGYLTPDTQTLLRTPGIRIMDEIDYITEEVGGLRDRGIDVIIAVGYSGYEMDQKIAREVEGIDVVVGGRSHTFLFDDSIDTPPDSEIPVGKYPTLVMQRNTNRLIPVVQAYHSTKYLGKLYVDFDKHGQVIGSNGNPILLDSSIEQDPYLLDLVNTAQSYLEPQEREVIGSTEVYLEGGPEYCMLKECNFGDFLLDSYVKYASTTYDHEIDDELYLKTHWINEPIAILNSSAIKCDISIGQITHGQLMTAIPFNNIMGKVTLTGADLKELFENVFWKFDGKHPRDEFLQISGLRVVIDLSKKSGERVISIAVQSKKPEIANQELFPRANYMVILSDHLLVSLSTKYKYTEMPEFNTFSKTLFDVTKAEIALRHYLLKSPISPTVDGRITVLHADNIHNADEDTD